MRFIYEIIAFAALLVTSVYAADVYTAAGAEAAAARPSLRAVAEQKLGARLNPIEPSIPPLEVVELALKSFPPADSLHETAKEKLLIILERDTSDHGRTPLPVIELALQFSATADPLYETALNKLGARLNPIEPGIPPLEVVELALQFSATADPLYETAKKKLLIILERDTSDHGRTPLPVIALALKYLSIGE